MNKMGHGAIIQNATKELGYPSFRTIFAAFFFLKLAAWRLILNVLFGFIELVEPTESCFR